MESGMIKELVTLRKKCIDLKLMVEVKDKEIQRQIAKRKLAEQVRNWTIILTVLIHLAIWLF